MGVGGTVWDVRCETHDGMAALHMHGTGSRQVCKQRTTGETSGEQRRSWSKPGLVSQLQSSSCGRVKRSSLSGRNSPGTSWIAMARLPCSLQGYLPVVAAAGAGLAGGLHKVTLCKGWCRCQQPQ